MTENRLPNIAENLKRIQAQVAEAALAAGRSPQDIRLMAVTKTMPAELVNQAIEQGIDLLGENRAQELLEKHARYTPGAEIHFIGGLQSNKVRQILDKVCMVQSVDRLSLAQEISRQCGRLGIDMDILLEVNIGREASKAGVLPEALPQLAAQVAGLPGLRIRGLMAIPPVCEKLSQAEGYFCQIQQLFVDIKTQKIDNVCMDVLSMGMSDDFTAAIRQGSTLVRLGRALFGSRR